MLMTVALNSSDNVTTFVEGKLSSEILGEAKFLLVDCVVKLLQHTYSLTCSQTIPDSIIASIYLDKVQVIEETIQSSSWAQYTIHVEELALDIYKILDSRTKDFVV